MSFRRPIIAGLGAQALALAALAACAPPAAVVPPAPPAPAGPACFDRLSQRGIAFETVSEHAAIGGCDVAGAVRVAALAAPFDKPATMRCDLALRLDDFETNVVQAAAERHFHRRVVEIYQFGAYSCRDIAGTHRLSEHAHGDAIDIAGFELEGGLKIMVKQHWRGAGERSRFLRDVARGACRMFSVVLTPDANRDHRDHIHLDLGPFKLCRA